jgi:Sulfotransferase family
VSGGNRLIAEPVFLLSPPRSGSTLLRCILDTHSRIRSPQELHLKHLRVRLESAHCRLSLELLGYPETELRHLLWDRLLYEELRSSGKQVLVEKSPCNVEILDELQRCWPTARFVILLRHPLRVARSVLDNFADYDLETATRQLARVDEAVQRLRSRPSGVLIVQYESLVASPSQTLRRICEYLGLAYEPEMLDYGQHDHGPYIYGLGDWGERIRGGVVLPDRALGPVPATHALAAICRQWGYDESTAPGGIPSS